MNFHRPWAIFALDAEHDAYGMARIAQAHNTCMSELASARAERDIACTALCPHGLDIAAKYENAKRELAAARQISGYDWNFLEAQAQSIRDLQADLAAARAAQATARKLLHDARTAIGYSYGPMHPLFERIDAALREGEK